MENELIDRIARLERENRRMKRVGAVGLLGLAAVLMVGAVQDKETSDLITARKFLLVDSANRPRATLEINSAGIPVLFFQQENGRRVVELNAAPLDGTAFLRFYKAQGDLGVQTSLQLDKRVLEIKGQGDRTGALLSVDANGVPQFLINKPQ